MTTTDTKYMDLPIGWIIPHPNNVRRVLAVESLTDSIAATGILEPLIVTPAPVDLQASSDGGMYLLLAGHRRLVAARGAGLTEVPCIVRHDLSNLGDQIFAMLTENDHRDDLNPVEQADAYQALLELDFNETAIADRIGRPRRHVRDRLKLSKSSDEIRTKIARGDVTLETALTIQSYAKHNDLAARLEKASGTDKWAQELVACDREKTRRAEQAKTIREYKTRGITVLRDTAARDDYRLTKARALGQDLLWEWKGRDEPSDAATSDGMVVGSFEIYSTDLFWYRLVPEKDTVDDTTPGGPAHSGSDSDVAETAARRADLEAEQAKLTEDLAVAATLRRRYLEDTLTAATAHDIARHIALASLTEQLEDCNDDEFTLIADLLGITLSDPDADDHLAAWTKQVIGDASTMNADQITVLAHILYQASAELKLADPNAWAPRASDWSYAGARAWRQELAEWFGYEWTDTEAALVDADTQARTGTGE